MFYLDEILVHNTDAFLSVPDNHRSMALKAIPHTKFYISTKEKTRTVNYAGLFIVFITDDNILFILTCNVFSSLMSEEINYDII